MSTITANQISGLSSSRRNQLREHYTQSQSRFIEGILNDSILDVIDTTPRDISHDIFKRRSPEEINTLPKMDVKDYLTIAIATKISRDKPQLIKDYFDRYEKLDFAHYENVSRAWMYVEEKLLEQRLGHEPSSKEFLDDFWKNNNGARHRVYYCLRHKDKVYRPQKIIQTKAVA